MKRTSCSACGSTDLEQFLDLGMSPIADAYTATADEVSPTYPLQVAVCGKCRLVQLLEVVPADVLFGTGYSFYSSASPPLSAYHTQYAQSLFGRYPDLLQRGVVEVGCNDGDFLRHFAAYPSLGVDPAAGPAEVAHKRGINVLVRPFGLAVAQEIVGRQGRAGVVFANHVLAHVEDVADVLAGVAHLLDDDGVAIVEVQYLPDLLVNNAFDLVYHEHRNFFSLTSLEHAASRHGLFVAHAQLTDRQGGSLRATLRKRGWLNGDIRGLPESERWLNDFSAYAGMQGRAERIRSRLRELVAAELDAGRMVTGFGAPAKATTLLNFCGLNADLIRYVTDTTEAKQGRFIPGTRIQILAPHQPLVPTTQLLLSWNYLGPILRNNPRRRWIVPFAAPVVIG